MKCSLCYGTKVIWEIVGTNTCATHRVTCPRCKGSGESPTMDDALHKMAEMAGGSDIATPLTKRLPVIALCGSSRFMGAFRDFIKKGRT